MCSQQPNDAENNLATTASELEALAQFHEFHRTHDVALRDTLVCKYLHLVQSVVRRFSGVGESLDDLIQEGAIGLMNAVDLFDPDRGVKFSTYACHLITSQIQHYLRDRGRLIRQPAWVQELSTKVTRTAEQLSQEMGRDAQTGEIAERLNISEESVQNILSARELNYVVSLNVPADGPGEYEMMLFEKDTLYPDTNTASLQLPVEDRIVLEEAIVTLKSLEQQVIRLFYYGDLNQTEIARKLGISVNYASYLLRRSIAKIKTRLDEQHRHEVETLKETTIPLAPTTGEVTIYDAASGVYTGAYLRVRAAEEIARAKRYPTNFTLLIAQVQGVNSDPVTLQPVLKAVGHLIRTNTRMVDLVSHMGNARFALLLPHTGREAKVLGERLCVQIATHEIRQTTNTAPLALNIGFSVFPLDGATVDVLFQRAEKAMFMAENQGANTVVSAASSQAGTKR